MKKLREITITDTIYVYCEDDEIQECIDRARYSDLNLEIEFEEIISDPEKIRDEWKNSIPWTINYSSDERTCAEILREDLSN